ncbi:MAG: hypothetical protein FD126_87 [Elusimicrobia bacterium]|nr:MAG: hypothetical protein FD126_87 [Elusimicrobiota bacterium]
MERRLVDVKGLSVYLNLPTPTVYSWKCRGKIPADCIVKLGGRMLRFDLAEIDKWVNTQRSS